jgi:hypothetical protein
VQAIGRDDEAGEAELLDLGLEACDEIGRRVNKQHAAWQANHGHPGREGNLWPKRAKPDDRPIRDPDIVGDGEC